MFKSTASLDEECDTHPVTNEKTSSTPSEQSYTIAPLRSQSVQRASGWSGLQNHMSSLESDYFLFKEKVAEDIKRLQSKIVSLTKIVEDQNTEIKYLKEENQNLREICIEQNNGKQQAQLAHSSEQLSILSGENNKLPPVSSEHESLIETNAVNLSTKGCLPSLNK